MADEVIVKSLTGFMRVEVKRKKEKGRKGAADHNVFANITNKNENARYGGSAEEYGSEDGAIPEMTEKNEDIHNRASVNDSGLPKRLPTEIMNTPPPEMTENNHNTYAKSDDTINSAFGLPARLPTEIMNSPPSEVYVESISPQNDEQYYYIKEGRTKGPCSVKLMIKLFENKEINEDTYIWDDTQTKQDAKSLKNTQRIVAKLPKPPPRKKRSNNAASAENVKSDESSRTSNAELYSANTPNTKNSKNSCCCIVL